MAEKAVGDRAFLIRDPDTAGAPDVEPLFHAVSPHEVNHLREHRGLVAGSLEEHGRRVGKWRPLLERSDAVDIRVLTGEYGEVGGHSPIRRGDGPRKGGSPTGESVDLRGPCYPVAATVREVLRPGAVENDCHDVGGAGGIRPSARRRSARAHP